MLQRDEWSMKTTERFPAAGRASSNTDNPVWFGEQDFLRFLFYTEKAVLLCGMACYFDAIFTKALKSRVVVP
jgi:hypothetical protein